MKKAGTVALSIFLVAGMTLNPFSEAETVSLESANHGIESKIAYESAALETPKIEIQSEVKVAPKAVEDKKPWLRKDVPLSEDWQKLIWETSKQEEVDYDLILALMKNESNFDFDAINYNTNGTFDSGILQVNSSNRKWVNELAGRKIDLKNDEDAMLAGILIFKYYYSAWEETAPKDKLVFYALESYNKGIGGWKKMGKPITKYSKRIVEDSQNID